VIPHVVCAIQSCVAKLPEYSPRGTVDEAVILVSIVQYYLTRLPFSGWSSRLPQTSYQDPILYDGRKTVCLPYGPTLVLAPSVKWCNIGKFPDDRNFTITVHQDVDFFQALCWDSLNLARPNFGEIVETRSDFWSSAAFNHPVTHVDASSMHSSCKALQTWYCDHTRAWDF